MPCSLVEVYRHFGGSYSLCFQDRSSDEANNLRKTSSKYSELGCLTLRAWRWRRYSPLKLRWNYIKLHGVKSQNTLLFTLCYIHWLITKCHGSVVNIPTSNKKLLGSYFGLMACLPDGGFQWVSSGHPGKIPVTIFTQAMAISFKRIKK
jgi:hypothetical protein